MLDDGEFYAVDPDTLDACGQALSAACETVAARQARDKTAIEPSTRRTLACSIMALAATGERNIEELKRYALRDLSVRVWRRPRDAEPTGDEPAKAALDRIV